MAGAFLRSFSDQLEVYSAGTMPASRVHPGAIAVMKEVGMDISAAAPKNVDRFLGEPFDYVITVCDNAKQTCPVFLGNVGHRLHIGFEDPAEASGTPEEIMNAFRRVRDDIRERMFAFYSTTLLPHVNQ
jgi:arsenate reductase